MWYSHNLDLIKIQFFYFFILDLIYSLKFFFSFTNNFLFFKKNWHLKKKVKYLLNVNYAFIIFHWSNHQLSKYLTEKKKYNINKYRHWCTLSKKGHFYGIFKLIIRDSEIYLRSNVILEYFFSQTYSCLLV